jgi:hypothetical protein
MDVGRIARGESGYFGLLLGLLASSEAAYSALFSKHMCLKVCQTRSFMLLCSTNLISWWSDQRSRHSAPGRV